MLQDAPQISLSEKGDLLFLRHGPIDLFMGVDTHDEPDRQKAFRIAAASFEPILSDLCGELDVLRLPVTTRQWVPDSPVAARMLDAVSVFSEKHFVTPMIAVAGSVADHLTQCVAGKVSARRIFVNNGGDISVRLSENQSFTVGICSDLATGRICSRATIRAEDDVGGVATSGWAGRSHSLGIADAVTVFAANAALADAAATLIANAVNLPSSRKIERAPARELNPDSDLGDMLVTTGVARLDAFEKQDALTEGCRLAEKMRRSGIIHLAHLVLQGMHRVVTPGKSDLIAGHTGTNSHINSEPAGQVHA